MRYAEELLNSIEVGASLPDHEISLNKRFVVMLLRNIKPSAGYVNGTRYVVVRMITNLLFLTSVSGSKTGSRVMLPRRNCRVSKDDFPIPGLKRCQFPIRLRFAMIINKVHVQSIREA